MRRMSFLFSKLLFLALVLCLLQIGCGGGDDDENGGISPPPRPANITGNAILDVQVVDGGAVGMGGVPPPAPAGYTLLNVDLNRGTGGNYIWLYYKVGKADGSEGQPVSKIYTVDEFDNETPQGGTKLPVNLNEGGQSSHEPLWLYYKKSDWPVARCIVVDARESDGSNHVRIYGPPEAAGQYQVVWVQELSPDSWKSPYTSEGIPPDAQDLNEGESVILPPVFYVSDYIYIGYCWD